MLEGDQAMNFGFACQLRVHGDPGGLEPQLDGIMEELCRLEVTDPWIGATLSRGEIEVTLAVEAPSFEEAVAKALTAVRTAIHAAGGGTPDWPVVERIEVERTSVPTPA
jgi:hypothetical protein